MSGFDLVGPWRAVGVDVQLDAVRVVEEHDVADAAMRRPELLDALLFEVGDPGLDVGAVLDAKLTGSKPVTASDSSCSRRKASSVRSRPASWPTEPRRCPCSSLNSIVTFEPKTRSYQATSARLFADGKFHMVNSSEFRHVDSTVRPQSHRGSLIDGFSLRFRTSPE